MFMKVLANNNDVNDGIDLTKSQVPPVRALGSLKPQMDTVATVGSGHYPLIEKRNKINNAPEC